MTRDQLEAVVWQHASNLNSVDPQDRADAMTAILGAADEYAESRLRCDYCDRLAGMPTAPCPNCPDWQRWQS